MLREYLSTLANAFREVLGTTKKINAQNFKSEIYSVFTKGLKTGEIAGFEQGKAEGVTEGKPLGKLELLQDSEYMNAKVSGTAISVNDVNAVEHSVGCYLTSDTITDFSGIEVSRYGKNLFDVNLDPHSIHYAVSLVSLNDGELTIKQNATAQYAPYNIAIPNANNLVGKTITISCDCKVGEGGNNTTVRILWLNSNGNSSAGTDILYKPYVSSTEYQHISVSGVVNAQPDESHDTLALMFYSNVNKTLSDGEYYSYFKNIQIELGTTATAYEPYTEPTTYQSTADGTVEGVKSISPNMTLLSNNNGVVINANYLRDIDTYIDNLITNVALTGGE